LAAGSRGESQGAASRAQIGRGLFSAYRPAHEPSSHAGCPLAIAAREIASRYYGEMEGLLADRDYLAGSYSYADIAFYMAQLFGARMGAPMTAATPKLLAWRDRITARPAVQRVVGAMAAYLLAQRRPLPDFLSAIMLPDQSG
jgi:glutathione S-transferase